MSHFIKSFQAKWNHDVPDDNAAFAEYLGDCLEIYRKLCPVRRPNEDQKYADNILKVAIMYAQDRLRGDSTANSQPTGGQP